MNLKDLHLDPKRLVPPAVLAVVAIGYLFIAGGFDDNTSAEAPLLYGITMLVLAVVVFIVALIPGVKAKARRTLVKHEEVPFAWKIASQIFAMVAAFIAGVFLVGFYVAIPLFLVLFLRFISKLSWLKAGIFAVVAYGLTWFLFSYVLSLEVFTGYLASYV